jgi:hypothetical protein
VLTHTLRTCNAACGPLLEELAHRHALEETPLIQSWYASKPAGDDEEHATAILEGLARAGASMRPVLVSLVRHRAPSGQARSAVVALVAATKAAGYAMPASCEGHLLGLAGKGMSREDQRRVEVEMVRVRTACVREASAVLRGPPTR